jgi:fucose 4-O-acetylase-like acetyltransferase
MEQANRNAFFDNLKFILIFFVIFAHTLTQLVKSAPIIEVLYTYIYSFHMFLFIFVSGYFSKKIGTSGFKKYDAVKLMLIYIISYLGYFFYSQVIPGLHPTNFDLTVPYDVLWYLVSLLAWRVFLPYVVELRHPIILSFLIAILSGYIIEDHYFLSLSRTIKFFPFFLCGYYLSQEKVGKLVKSFPKPLAVSLLGLTFLIFMVVRIKYNFSYFMWFYNMASYATLGVGKAYGWLGYGIVYTVAVINSVCLMALVPWQKTRFTELGQNTLYPFVLHDFFIMLSDSFIEKGFFPNIYIAFLSMLILSVILTYGLTQHFVRKTFRFFMEP